jgi:phosphoglucosamine mutase
VDGAGNIVDGDFIMAIMALDMMKRGNLSRNTVVGTIMTNMGFTKFCEANDIRFESTKVGDRYVLEEMIMEDYNFGGEQSGHLIFRDYGTTGDGLLAALQILRIMRETGKTLSELAKCLKPFPQVLLNVKVTRKTPFEECEKLMQAQKDVEAQLAGKGRVLLRYSGTENLCRIMVEGENEDLVRRSAELLAEVADLELR